MKYLAYHNSQLDKAREGYGFVILNAKSIKFRNELVKIACQDLHFAQTEDIWLKPALEWERGVFIDFQEEVLL